METGTRRLPITLGGYLPSSITLMLSGVAPAASPFWTCLPSLAEIASPAQAATGHSDRLATTSALQIFKKTSPCAVDRNCGNKCAAGRRDRQGQTGSNCYKPVLKGC